MQHRETAATFQQRLEPATSNPGQFTLYRTEAYCQSRVLPHARRDFYKIALVLADDGQLACADITYHIRGGLFFNPLAFYSWTPFADQGRWGYACLFTETFLQSPLRAEGLTKANYG